MAVQVVTTEYGGSYLKCNCDQTAIRYRVRSDGIGIYVIQCLSCGRQIRAIPKKSPEALSLTERTPFDETLQTRWHEREQAFWRDQSARRVAQQQAETDRQNAEWWKWYDQYLKTPEWKAKRALVMERAGGMCEGCRQRKATQIHHLTYDHAGDELLFELVAVCGGCHQRIHPDKDLQ